MNDPGLDEPIAGNAEDVENIERDEEEAEEDEESDYLQPAIWWFASTAFPLMAGTFGPMASAFSICSLAVQWRVEIPPGKTEADGIEVPDPSWLIAVNAIQLGIALMSNLFLLLNMARRVRFTVAQPITIIGWYISSFALISLCACASRPLIIEPRETHALTQAFYYALFAAGLYFFVASLMLVTVYGAYKQHYSPSFQLTISQRTLMLQTISFLTYLLSGAAVFAHIEGWKFLDGVYWADFTLLTVGIGDISPTTHLGRSLLFPYAIVGIIILGLVIGSIRSLVLERGKERMGRRMMERERRRLVRKLEGEKELKPIVDQQTEKAHQAPTSHAYEQKKGKRKDKNSKTPKSERDRRHREFHLMRRIQHTAHVKRRWTSLCISLTTWMALWFLGAAIFHRCERSQGWSYFISLYFSYTSLLTIGYGDFYPTSSSGRAFFVFWSLLAVPSLTILISNMGDTIVKVIRDLTLWVGDITVLPGEKGMGGMMREFGNRLSSGRLFGGYEDVEEAPPNIPNADKKIPSLLQNKTHKRNDPESAEQKVGDEKANTETSNAHNKGKKNDKLPKNRHHYHLLLIREISSVLSHLNSSPPRQYTFEEWAWYLKLVGEDEADGRKHREPIRRPKQEEKAKKEGAETRDGQDEEGIGDGGTGSKEGKGEARWSWVGNRSPLLGGKEEAEWVLERLTKTLERELEEIKREQEEAGEREGKSGR